MIQSGLFFVLGLLCAAFLALMAAPAIWRRAVYLTRKRIEASVPLSVNEIQADKDKLRAEFAMSTRRLEMSIQKFRDRASMQLAEISRNREDIKALARERDEKIETIAELETREREMRETLKQREAELDASAVRLAELGHETQQRASELVALERRLMDAESVADMRKIELVARDTELEQALEELESLRRSRTEANHQFRALDIELAATRDSLTTERKRFGELQARLERMATDGSDKENKLERREGEVARLRERVKTDAATIRDLEARTLAADQERAELEAELAELTARLNGLVANARGGEFEKSFEVLKRNQNRLEANLLAVARERDELRERMRDIDANAAQRWDSERRENAVLREQINDLAAEVVRLTAMLEGPDSPINTLLAETPSVSPQEPEDYGEGMSSLAQRIRKLQKLAASQG